MAVWLSRISPFTLPSWGAIALENQITRARKLAAVDDDVTPTDAVKTAGGSAIMSFRPPEPIAGEMALAALKPLVDLARNRLGRLRQ